MEGELLFLSSSGLLRLINQLFLISNKNVLVLWTKKKEGEWSQNNSGTLDRRLDFVESSGNKFFRLN